MISPKIYEIVTMNVGVGPVNRGRRSVRVIVNSGETGIEIKVEKKTVVETQEVVGASITTGETEIEMVMGKNDGMV